MRLFLSILLVALALPARAAIYSATVTVTNSAGTTNGQTILVGASTRTWTNSVIVPTVQILTNNTAAGAADNLVAHLGGNPFSGKSASHPTATTVKITGADGDPWFAVTLSAGWATVSYATNTATPATSLRIPFSVVSAEQRTNAASEIAALLSSGVSTNPLTVLAATYVTTGDITNRVYGTNIIYYTNQAGVAVDLTIPTADMATNRPFAFSGVLNKSAIEYQSAVRLITNYSGTNISFTAPASVHLEGTPWVTNVTSATWFYNPGRWTNLIAVPLW